jgi:molecular chaperone DnaJ
VRAQQGFFTVERTCPTCGGRGQIIKNPCSACAGAGRVRKDRTLNVNIPAGVETGTRIRLAGEGEAGLRGGPSGDLYIFIEVEPHAIFERDGQNLYCRIPVSMTTAALGGEIDAPTLKVPAGVQSGKQLRLRGKGMPGIRAATAGDLYIELAVETPVNLSARQRELLREFEDAGRDNSPETQDFFSKVKGFWDGMRG